ncbi:MAG TPA: rRNA maturation RNase YbeY [Gemmobacter sp.]|nr:rRNA maturation RNase YbeY [Gemmobacter sp.]
MSACVEIVIEDDRWVAFGLEAVACHAMTATLGHLGLDPVRFQIVVMGCDDARISALNGSFRGKAKPTNVLSWPSEERGSEYSGEAPVLPEPGTEDDPFPLGDIAIAWETCAREAAEQGKSVNDHVVHLLIHGILHLLGYDHMDDDDAELMEATERQVLTTLGIDDPYEVPFEGAK